MRQLRISWLDVALILFVGIALIGVVGAYTDCHRRGGVLVRGVFTLECLNPRATRPTPPTEPRL